MNEEILMFYVVWYTDGWYETEDGWCVVSSEEKLKDTFTQIKVKYPGKNEFLHIFAYKFLFDSPCLSTNIMEPYKEYKRF
jgi:hypothetical protein